MRAEVLRRVRAEPRAVVLLDIDSTLLDTGARHLAILTAFAEQTGDDGLIELVGTLQPGDFGWSVDTPLVGTAWAYHRDALLAFWWQGFFSDRYLVDRPVLGALTFVQKLHGAGAWVYYLTARDVPGMGAATSAQLLSLGFPLLGGRASLHLKPSRSVTDTDFKQHALQSVARCGTVVATFENEPGNANLFQAAFPQASHYLLDTVCSPDPPALHEAIERITDFR